ncbi:MAG: NAD(P)H-binding protein [Betaproteobacteria bacterium]
MASRILVTGSTGNIGRELVKQPQARGADFAVMTSAPGKAPAGVREVRGDFTQPTELATAFAGSDTLFLLFPLVPDMLDMARNAVAAAKAAGARHIVRSSGAGADSHRPASIARGHGQIDDLITGIGIAYTLPRPASLMQSAINFSAGTIKGANAIYAPHGTGATAVIDVRDIAEAAAVVLTAPAAHAGASYTLTGAEAMTDAQMAAEIGRAVGRDVQYVDVPEQAAVGSMTKVGFPPQLIDWLMSLNHVIKQGWAARVTGDVRRLTGHAPRSFAAFAREHAAAWR